MHFIARIISALVSAVALTLGVAQPTPTHEDLVRVTRVPAQTAITRTVTGSYGQHAAVIGELLAYARQHYPRSVAARDAVFGVYPVDPDAVPATAELKWEIALAVDASEAARKPDPPYQLKTLPAVEAAVLDSDVAHTGIDGLAMQRWLLENGYVQVAPTRMRFTAAAGDPQNVVTRIVIPVVARVSGLKLPRR